MLADSSGEKQENDPTPAEKTTMLILMAPPKDLQQVLLCQLLKGGEGGSVCYDAV